MFMSLLLAVMLGKTKHQHLMAYKLSYIVITLEKNITIYHSKKQIKRVEMCLSQHISAVDVYFVGLKSKLYAMLANRCT